MCRRFARLSLYGLKVRCAAVMKRLKMKMENGKMKKVLTFGILAGLLFCGCQKEEFRTDTVSEQEIFTAVIEDIDPASTRTSLDGSGNVLWKKGDEISIFAGSTLNVEYKVSDESDGKTSAVMTKVSSESFTAGTELECNVAYYPYTSCASIARSSKDSESPVTYTISDISLPATQIYAEDSFGNGSFPMAAVTSSTEDKNLKFKNILGGLKLQLKGSSKIKSVSVRGNAGEILCGSGSVTVSSTAVPAISLTDAAATTVTLDCGTEGVQLNAETATCFIISLPPMTMASGFTVTVRDTDGKAMEIKTTKSQTINRSKLRKMPSVDYVGTEDYTQQPLTFTSMGETVVSITQNGSPEDITLQYRTDAIDWTAYTVGKEITLTDGAELQFRAGEDGNTTFSSSDGTYNIVMSGDGTVKVSGNIMSLLDNKMSRTDVPEYCFGSLFRYCGNLTDAADLKLPAMTLAGWCYSSMFLGCTSLTTAPDLPAADLAVGCYTAMFSYCTNLKSAPALEATKLFNQCYNYMFENCTSLTTAPDLPATDLADYCYYGMFSGCSSLETAPELWATTLANYCYEEMFSGCSALTTAPELRAETLSKGCYTNMFKGCAALTAAPDLPAKALANYCYSYMFAECTSLLTTPSELPATTLADNCYECMFQYCSALAAAPALPAEEMTALCYSNMFAGCSSLTQAPELKAKILARCCYQSMFQDCTALTSAPKVLPAEELTANCYSKMFKGCSKLTQAPELPAMTMNEYSYQCMFQNCTSLETAPTLPATTLAKYCYTEMFSGCSALTTAPALSATTMSTGCYSKMFQNCTSLKSAPVLPATALTSDCYWGMFSGCSSLNYIKALFTNRPSEALTSGWVSGVAQEGTFVMSNSVSWKADDFRGANGIPEGWTVQTTE